MSTHELFKNHALSMKKLFCEPVNIRWWDFGLKIVEYSSFDMVLGEKSWILQKKNFVKNSSLVKQAF